MIEHPKTDPPNDIPDGKIQKDKKFYFKCLKCSTPITECCDLWIHDKHRLDGRLELYCSNCTNDVPGTKNKQQLNRREFEDEIRRRSNHEIR